MLNQEFNELTEALAQALAEPPPLAELCDPLEVRRLALTGRDRRDQLAAELELSVPVMADRAIAVAELVTLATDGQLIEYSVLLGWRRLQATDLIGLGDPLSDLSEAAAAAERLAEILDRQAAEQYSRLGQLLERARPRGALELKISGQLRRWAERRRKYVERIAAAQWRYHDLQQRTGPDAAKWLAADHYREIAARER